MEVWIAFGCGLLIGSVLGTLCLGLVGLNRTTRLWDELDIANNRVEELTQQRQFLSRCVKCSSIWILRY